MVEPEAGMECWLRGSALDPRIPQRTRTRILSVWPGAFHFEVVVGRSWQVTVSLMCLDCGREFRTASGAWIPETDPRARRWIQRLLDDARAGGTKWKTFHSEVFEHWTVAELEWVLERSASP
jgi:hypothetical protein